MPHPIVFTALAWCAATPATSCAPVATEAAVTERGDFAELEAAYARANTEHGKRVQELTQSGGDPKSLRHPAVEFFPRFEALAAKGDGRALLWMADRVGAAHPDRAKETNRDEAWKLHTRVATEHADAPWIGQWVSKLTSLYVDHGAEKVDPVVDAFVAESKQTEAVAEALYRAREDAKRAKRDERAKTLDARLSKDFAETKYGKRARGVTDAPTGPVTAADLAVGKVAPDFTTKDTDGVEFKLSDYRGKVVVLDFWGFW